MDPMQLRKQLLGPQLHPFVGYIRRTVPIILAAFALSSMIAIHVSWQHRRDEAIATCDAGSYVVAIDDDGLPTCSRWVDPGFSSTRSAGAHVLEDVGATWNGALVTDSGDVKLNELSGNTTIGGTYNETTAALGRYGITGTTNSIAKYTGTVTISDPWLTDDGTTVTVDLDLTDRTVVVKRPGTSDSVTITKAPLALAPILDLESVRSP